MLLNIFWLGGVGLSNIATGIYRKSEMDHSDFTRMVAVGMLYLFLGLVCNPLIYSVSIYAGIKFIISNDRHDRILRRLSAKLFAGAGIVVGQETLFGSPRRPFANRKRSADNRDVDDGDELEDAYQIERSSSDDDDEMEGLLDEKVDEYTQFSSQPF
eukprot:GEZU01016243.1.p1 GENE.GEZU01016243.1~~GEZU01016243.1.p1  ORF type:complete len:157 (-),score=5.98 GEZU01016243.1:42-512(-)